MDIDIYTSILSGLSCFWIIFKYLQQPKDNIGLLLVFVLAISDLVFAFSILTYHVSQDESVYQDAVFLFSMQFSILWASTVSFIVYKSLQDTTLHIMNLFKTTLGVIILISAGITTFLSIDAESQFSLLNLLPLAISLILTFVFYSMSIKILKQRAEYSQISTNIYVRTLRSYSVVQFLTYGPLIMFLMINIFDAHLVPIDDLIYYLAALRTLATLSGFFNTLIFILQGTGTLKRSTNPTDNNLEADLTLDISST